MPPIFTVHDWLAELEASGAFKTERDESVCEDASDAAACVDDPDGARFSESEGSGTLYTELEESERSDPRYASSVRDPNVKPDDGNGKIRKPAAKTLHHTHTKHSQTRTLMTWLGMPTKTTPPDQIFLSVPVRQHVRKMQQTKARRSPGRLTGAKSPTESVGEYESRKYASALEVKQLLQFTERLKRPSL